MDSPVRIQLKKNDYLRHKFFRTLNRRKKRLLLQLIEAPEKELRRRLRLKRYEGGKNPMDYEYRGTIYDDELKNQGITHVAELPEVVVKGRDYTKPYESAFEYDPNFAKELPYFLPVVGDALDAVDVARDVYNGNYLSAGIGAGMLALPNFIEKPAKGVGKIIRRTTDAQKAQNIIDANNISKWTPAEWTAAQDAAIARGDMAEAKRLRDLHFIVKTPGNRITRDNNLVQLYHGTNDDWHSYDYSRFGQTDGGYYGKGWYLSADKNYADTYGNRTMKLYAYSKNPIELGPSAKKIDYDAAPFFGRDLDNADIHKDYIEYLKNKDAVNYWSVINGDLSPFKELVIKNPSKVKSSYPVTYDNNGVRIPLGDRDNFNINDIRYGLLPLGIGLATYGAANYDNGTAAYSKGKDSGIHIKPENRGKFNALKKRTGKTTEELTHSKNPLTRKRAIFALNARKWNHKK